jgi:anaphase-promoting complex subunit 2
MAQSAVDTSWIHSLNTVLPILLQQKNDSLILTVLIDTIRRELTEKIIPVFLGHIEQWNEQDVESADQILEQAINIILPFVDSSLQQLNSIQSHSATLADRIEQELRRLWSAALLHFVPQLNQLLRAYLTRQFALVDQIAAKHEGDHIEFTELLKSQHATHIAQYSTVCRQLRALNLHAVIEQLATTVIIAQISQRVHERCKSCYDTPLLHEGLLGWFDKAVSAWLDLTLQGDLDAQTEISAACKRRTLSSLYEQFADLRIAELFDIIIEYPDSTPALTDLRECLNKTSKHKELIIALKQSLKQRLLIPSAETLSIVQCYVRTIKTLLYLDPSAVLLAGVSATLAEYLQQNRPDTLRTIVTQLTQAALSDDPEAAQSDLLLSELQNSETAWKDRDADDGSSDEEDENKRPWHPEPLYIQPGSHREQKPVDILSMLINIYGSRDLFVDEYTNMLADRLLAITDFNTDKEIKNIELLKLKFGENSFQRAAIMLRDMMQSKRVNALIVPKIANTEDTHINVPLSATVVSGLFWPAFKNETVALPEPVQRKLDAYCKEFETQKPSQKLYIKEHLGQVDLELEFLDGRVLDYSVSPLLATIIFHFQEQPQWPLADLAAKLNIAPDLMRRRLAYWLNSGVVTEFEPDHFQLEENGPVEQVQFTSHDDEDGANGAQQQDEWTETHENLILGMLTNLGEQSLDKIHSMMSLFVEEYDKTTAQLANFLARLVQQEKIESSGAMYSLRQK